MAVLCSCAQVHARYAAAGVITPLRSSRFGEATLSLRGGANEPSDSLLQATFAANRLTSSVLADASGEIAALRKRVAGGEAVPAFGAKADELLADALNKFEAETPKGDVEVSSLYQNKAEELRSTLTASLEPVFVQQIVLLKDGARSMHRQCSNPPMHKTQHKNLDAQNSDGTLTHMPTHLAGAQKRILAHVSIWQAL